MEILVFVLVMGWIIADDKIFNNSPEAHYSLKYCPMTQTTPLNRPLPDQDQRQAALDPNRSFIVQAPAGSGKTELLTQRYLKLLTTVKHPEEIIAITFTRKAAGEMKSRILQALALKPEIEQQAKLLQNPQRLRILTIDALCAHLTRQMPILAEFGGQPEILLDPLPAYTEAARRLLAQMEENLPWSQAVATLIQYQDNQQEQVEQLLVQMLSKREQWLPHVVAAQQSNHLKANLEQGLQQIILESLHTLQQHLSAALLSKLLTFGSLAAKNLQAAGITEHPLLALLNAPAALRVDLEYYPQWCALSHLLLTKDFSWRKTVNKTHGFPADKDLAEPKQGLLDILKSLAEDEKLRASLQAVQEAPAPHYTPEQWPIVAALLELLPIAAAQLRVVFQELGRVDFIEMARAAALALGTPSEPTDLALHLDYKIKHLLIDEFQDTSVAQFHLLERLTAGWAEGDGHSLFLVGDPMQSIYRFREAEVGLFLQAHEQGIGNIRLHYLQLQVNFRSQANIVTWINQQFINIFPAYADKSTGAVAYCASISAKPEDPNSQIKLHLAQDEADSVQQLLQILHTQRTLAPTQTIAILVRARTHLRAILPALKQAGLPYQAIEIEAFSHHAHIQDLLALTRALLHNADRIAWLSVLRAPWCGLSLTDLYLAAPASKKLTVFEQLQENHSKLSNDGQIRLQRVLNIFKHSLAQLFHGSLSNCVEGTWLALGGPACLEQAAQLKDAEVFFNLLDELAMGGDIADLTSLTSRLDALYASTVSADLHPIQVMTIHKSKGLEFDTVLIPELHRQPAGQKAQLLLWLERTNAEGQQDLILAPIKEKGEAASSCYQYLQKLEAQRQQHEMGRLLYVAATRARSNLHLLALAEPKNESEWKRPITSSLLGHLWALVQKQPITIAKTSPLIAPLDLPVLSRLPVNWQHPITLPAYIVSAPAHLTPHYPWQSPTPKHIGTVVHQLLQNLAEQGLQHYKNLNLNDFHKIWRNQLLRLGVPTSELDLAITTIHKAIAQTLNDHAHHWIFSSKHQSIENEYALNYSQNGRLHTAIIDRTFITADHTRWIIDYKTSSPDAQQNLTVFLKEEQARYKPQLEHYAQLMHPLDPSTPIQLGLYFPLCASWISWEYTNTVIKETS